MLDNAESYAALISFPHLFRVAPWQTVMMLVTRLASILKLKSGSTNILNNRESSRLEFKRAFHMDWGNYAKSIAAFAYTSGGFIVFGVENRPHKLVGVTSKIDSFEPAKLTDYLNAAFSPEIDWELDACEFEGIRLGYLYTPRGSGETGCVYQERSQLEGG